MYKRKNWKIHYERGDEPPISLIEEEIPFMEPFRANSSMSTVTAASSSTPMGERLVNTPGGSENVHLLSIGDERGNSKSGNPTTRPQQIILHNDAAEEVVELPPLYRERGATPAMDQPPITP
ncbi:hypothetical protein M422DRAFT_51668 [Sphaerobolus stellatus SS14]|uniref:Uncharacterized protein n=1 Tax=Sphaerobolus stellatus (strain SS14) TaxID=990650 RepID=A0A0C9TWY0_SPHS4|nr:hypothetical protein M422DRAFT_51668 [Sphaerobolus stellatus SS14]